MATTKTTPATTPTPATAEKPKREVWIQTKAATGEFYCAWWDSIVPNKIRAAHKHPTAAGAKDEAKRMGWTVKPKWPCPIATPKPETSAKPAAKPASAKSTAKPASAKPAAKPATSAKSARPVPRPRPAPVEPAPAEAAAAAS